MVKLDKRMVKKKYLYIMLTCSYHNIRKKKINVEKKTHVMLGLISSYVIFPLNIRLYLPVLFEKWAILFSSNKVLFYSILMLYLLFFLIVFKMSIMNLLFDWLMIPLYVVLRQSPRNYMMSLWKAEIYSYIPLKSIENSQSYVGITLQMNYSGDS